MNQEPERCRLLESLSGILARFPWQAKYLVFSSPRQGAVALCAVARAGHGWVNARASSLGEIATTLSGPDLAVKGLTSLSPVLFEDMVERAWIGAEEESGPGLLGPRTPGAVESLARTIHELRMNGSGSEALEKRNGPLARVYGKYLELLRLESATDRAAKFESALGARPGSPGVLITPAGFRVGLSRLEKELLAHLERQGWSVAELRHETIVSASNRPGGDAPRLAWIGAPTEKGRRAGPEIQIFRAASPWCEVREIWRRILCGDGKNPLPFDQIEIALVDPDAYAPLVYEIARQFVEEPANIVTFEYGMPAMHARPARCLLKYLEWISEDFDASILHELLASGDLPLERLFGERGPYAYRLARAVRKVGAFRGLAEARARILASRVAAEAEKRAASKHADTDGEPFPDAGPEKPLDEEWLEKLLGFLTDGLEPMTAATLGTACLNLLGLFMPVSELEQAAIRALEPEMGALGQVKAEVDRKQILRRFMEATCSIRVAQAHPGPGRVHVTDLSSAGLDGRPFTFVPGMDDSRYPGVLLPDPYLRERDRGALGIPTREKGFSERDVFLRRALARLRGSVTFSWPSREPGKDRECFPSRVVLDAWRLGPGTLSASYSDILAEPETADPAYTPSRMALTRDDELVARSLFADPDAREAVARESAGIALGLDAIRARASLGKDDPPGPFNGMIGPYRDPRKDVDFVLSPSRLSTLARCPFRYFLQYVLGLEAPETLEWDPLAWLDSMERGLLLHEVYFEYGKAVMAGRTPDLRAIAERIIGEWRMRLPPPSDVAFGIERDQILKSLDVFLWEWKRLAGEWEPRELELGFGMGTRGDGRYPDPVPVPTGTGSIRLRGRIDRLDVSTKSRKKGAVWDYKAGKFTGPEDNYGKGELMQPVLYAMVAERIFEDLHVGDGGFLFVGKPGQRARAPVDCGRAGREKVGEILDGLCDTLAGGVFRPARDEDNCSWCDFANACQRK